MDEAVERAILTLAAERGPQKSICPSDAAKAVGGEAWNRLLPLVRRTAVRLALEGRIEITRKGKPVDPTDFKGVYRLRIAGG